MYYKRYFGTIQKSAGLPSWVKWTHHSEGKTHCEECLRLDDCHCTLDPIPYTIVVSNAAAHSAYSKFDPYLFNTRGEHSHGKDKLFHEWGYTVVDAFWLQKEIERQAREKYVSGNYELGRLNFAGQRIRIRIEIPRRNGDGPARYD